MTDTESTKATPDTDAAETDAPTQTIEEAVAATASETDALDAFFATPAALPGAPEGSADGKWIAFLQPGADGAAKLWIAPTDGGDPRELPVPFTPVEDINPETGRHLRGPQWSPDGTRIAVTGMHPDGDRTAVWLVPTGVGEPAAPAAPASADAAPATGEDAPEADTGDLDDRVIAAAETADVPEGMAEPLPKLDEVDAADEDANAVTTGDVDAQVLASAETADVPDGMPEPLPKLDAIDADEHIPGDNEEASAATGTDTDTSAPVAPQGAAPEEARLLIDHAGADRSPRWSPDGQIIAMTSRIDGREVIALVPVADADVSAMELLTWSMSNDHEPVWSRDGKFLAFLRQLPDGPDYNDIWCYVLETGTLMNLTESKDAAIRHSLEWVPGRNLVAYVTRDNDWLSISVVNADNKAGWTVTRESGDKTEPRFAQDEARLVYIRTEGFTTVVCERSLHASSAVALDPGEGVARHARWLAGKRVLYGFSAPQRPYGFIAQENLADAERTFITLPDTPSLAGQDIRQPQPFEFETGPDEMFSGMLYRTPGVAGGAPAIVYMPDGPLGTRRGEFQLQEQALASTALSVLTPVIHGASGFGAAIEDDLREFATAELEVNDLAEAGRALGREENIAADKIAIVGHGYGGTLALLTAGARPGIYGAVVAIDPITDWSIELGNCDVAWRNWVVDRFGMPLSHADNFAMRSPATFSAVIDAPLLLVRTGNAPEYRRVQMDLFLRDLEETGVAHEVYDADGETLPAVLRQVSKRLAQTFLGGDHADVVDSLRADDIG